MKTLILLLVLSLALGPRSLAQTPSPTPSGKATAMKAGDIAKYDGVLLDADKANFVEQQVKQNELYKEIIDSQSKSIDLLKENETYDANKVSLLSNQNDQLAEQLQKTQGMTNWERIGLVALGVVMTIGAGLAIRGASH